ncbi:threonine/serine ThrE exporter family protein [Enterococcus ureasiticus]|uniref:Threonine/serine exporter-like N-terminal domain-containing protein n=1 Tax=Enterococcus ureasiticus TaxID=903984 RepID=A0A1E5GGQ2_9ENTE|nr:threonine/serine exporter family protein [Enterococcus ureasiticus]OEG11904.1 hypothetical protein BCR21_06625 [Enterococcus ureasiticus]
MDEKEKFDLIFDIGKAMLENGAEVSRIESTIAHLANSLELEGFNAFVSIDRIFLTCSTIDQPDKARVSYVPISPVSLGRIDRLNSLSRNISEKVITLYDAKVQLKEIKTEHFSSTKKKFVAYVLGSASFCYILGGTLIDSLSALLLGAIIGLYTLFVLDRLTISHIIKNVTSSFIVSVVACFMVKKFPHLNLVSLISGGIITLLPGVAISNGIRYLFDENYSSGWSQILNSLITALCVSIGVGIALKLFN